ncbi:MAG: hypothetical protein DYG94_02115 [Leptolyngbya sp. PLA3]|nr:MAG: hypothetical protein EDM82_02440 [Cyanobacteria bacterium CYA]MCE7967527.1 hypothetical protein [Leptolyngbya sp. PL-A3]
MPARFVRSLSFSLALAASTLLSVRANAQATRVAVVKEAGAVMRAGDMPRFYRVADLAPGSIVRVLDEVDGWAQVVYPESLNAYVEASKSRKVDDRTIELTDASSLLAPSALLGASGSWCALYAQPLPAGTRLELVEEAIGIDQKVSKYLVKPPRGTNPPRGFVRAEELRPATPEEVARTPFATPAQPQEKPEEKPAQPLPAPTTPNAVPTTPPEQPTSVTPGQPATYPGVDNSLLRPMEFGVLPDVKPDPNLATNGQGAPPVPAGDVTTLTINQLNQAFEDMRALPQDKVDAGLEELLAECRRSAAAVSSEPELFNAINQRIEWINLRIKLRDERRAIQQTIDQADARSNELAAKVQQWQSSRGYILVGRVAPSTLYDGRRLPLMYRVESVDGPGFARTIGYLRPEEGRNFDDQIGAVVGVVGKTIYDDVLGVRIIKPERLDALDPR